MSYSREGGCSTSQYESALASAQTARVVFVSRSLYQL